MCVCVWCVYAHVCVCVVCVRVCMCVVCVRVCVCVWCVYVRCVLVYHYMMVKGKTIHVYNYISLVI